MNIKKLYQDGKKRALTLSYDDGIEMDRRFVGILNKYGIKCTFNLNSGIQTTENGWTEGDTEIRRMDPEGLDELYKGHEVAMHMAHHPWPTKLSDDELRKEVLDDRKTLEERFGYRIDGMAYPFGDYDERVIKILEDCGVKYARTVVSTEKFTLPERWLEWHATCHHSNARLKELTAEFLSCEDELAIFYLWGHSYEFEVHKCWNIIEKFCEEMSGREDIWYATNMEIYDYINAVGQLKISEKEIYNPADVPVWVEADGKVYEIAAGARISL